MPERLTPEQLQEIEARLEKATPGPWQTRFIYRSLQSTRKHASEDHLMLGPDNDWNDADLTANAPTDIRALLAEIKALKQELDESHIELRYNADGSLDELFGASSDVHLEQMNHNEWCLIVERGEDKVILFLSTNKAIIKAFESAVEGSVTKVRRKHA